MTCNSFGYESADSVLREVSEKHGIPVYDIVGKRRFRSVVNARAEVYARLRDQHWSYPHIGSVVGGRDHTTVMAMLKSRGYQDAEKKIRISDACAAGPAFGGTGSPAEGGSPCGAASQAGKMQYRISTTPAEPE